MLAQPDDDTKRAHLLEVFRERGHEVLVESGTYLGDTVAAFVPHAARILSIEVEPALHQRAVARFAGQPQVELLLGDALDVVPQVLRMLDRPPLVWLDGHFSAGITGQGAEIEPAATILRRIGRSGMPAGTTLVVDDLRLFGRDPEFPLLEELVEGARLAAPSGRVYTGLDSLIIEA